MIGCLISNILLKKKVIELPLSGHTSICQPRAGIIISKDTKGKQTHKALNNLSYVVSHYRIDGIVIKSGKKCDYLLLNEDRGVAYFIELKGQDLSWAAQQIEATEIALNAELENYSNHQYRIVTNKCRTHDIESSRFKRYRERWGNKLKYKTLLLEETL